MKQFLICAALYNRNGFLVGLLGKDYQSSVWPTVGKWQIVKELKRTGYMMQEVWRVRNVWGNWDLKAPRAEVGMEVGGNPSDTHWNLFFSFCIG